MNGSAWPASRCARLRRLWRDKRLSTRKIGQALGLTKDAVIGKAGRLGLPNRVTGKRRIAYTNALRRAREMLKKERTLCR